MLPRREGAARLAARGPAPISPSFLTGSLTSCASTHPDPAPPLPPAEAARKLCPQFGFQSAKEHEAQRQATIGAEGLRVLQRDVGGGGAAALPRHKQRFAGAVQA